MNTVSIADRLVDEQEEFIRAHQPPHRPLSDEEIRAMAKSNVEQNLMLSSLSVTERARLTSFQLKLDFDLMVGNTWPGEWAKNYGLLPEHGSDQMAQVIEYLKTESFGPTRTVILRWYPATKQFRIERDFTSPATR